MEVKLKWNIFARLLRIVKDSARIHDYLFIILFHLHNYQYHTVYPVGKSVTALGKPKYLLFNFHSKQRLWIYLELQAKLTRDLQLRIHITLVGS